MSSRKAITILMPTFNAGRFLPESVSHIVSQTFDDWELILVDDGSTDNTPVVIESLLRQYPDRAIGACSIRHVGCAGALKKTIELATAPLCTFVGADDMLVKDSLEVITDLFVEHPEVVFLWTRWKHTGGRACWTRDLPAGRSLKDALLSGWWGAQAQQAFRRKAYFRAGELDPSIPLAADLQLTALFASLGKPVLSVPRVTYIYRGHDAQSSHQRHDEQRHCARTVLDRLRRGVI